MFNYNAFNLDVIFNKKIQQNVFYIRHVFTGASISGGVGGGAPSGLDTQGGESDAQGGKISLAFSVFLNSLSAAQAFPSL